MKQASAHSVRVRRPWLTWIIVGGVAVAAIVAAAAVVLLPRSGPPSAASVPTSAAGAAGDGGSGDAPVAAGAPDGGPKAFVAQPGFQPGDTPPCLLHQTSLPGASYQDADGAASADQLTFVSYYTAAGQLPFCDGRPSNADDKAWAQLYVQVTSSASDVSTILG